MKWMFLFLWKGKKNFKRIIQLVNVEYQFIDQEQARTFFIKLTGLFKNLNYAEFESIKYKELANKAGESLFLRKLVLGIPAQASGKNLTRPLMPSAPIRPAYVLICHTT